MKPLVRVTQLENFRRMLGDYSYVTEESFIESLTGVFLGNVKTRIGTAFHSIVETGKPECKVVGAGVRDFTYYNKPQQEPVPCGREFDIDGFKVRLDVPQCKVALDYRNQYPNAYHEIRTWKDYGDFIVTGQADMIDGFTIRDIKTKYSAPDDKDYIDSYQWRYYLDMFGCDTFYFDLFCFEDYKEDKHGYDVRGLKLSRYEPAIECDWYDGLSVDIRGLLSEFKKWADFRGMTEKLPMYDETKIE